VTAALSNLAEPGAFERAGGVITPRSAGAVGSRGDVDRRDDRGFGEVVAGLVFEVKGECLSEVGARLVDCVTLAGDLDFEAPGDVPVAFTGDRSGQAHMPRIPGPVRADAPDTQASLKSGSGSGPAPDEVAGSHLDPDLLALIAYGGLRIVGGLADHNQFLQSCAESPRVSTWEDIRAELLDPGR
jgi:hypothetical protein